MQGKKIPHSGEQNKHGIVFFLPPTAINSQISPPSHSSVSNSRSGHTRKLHSNMNDLPPPAKIVLRIIPAFFHGAPPTC